MSVTAQVGNRQARNVGKVIGGNQAFGIGAHRSVHVGGHLGSSQRLVPETYVTQLTIHQVLYISGSDIITATQIDIVVIDYRPRVECTVLLLVTLYPITIEGHHVGGAVDNHSQVHPGTSCSTSCSTPVGEDIAPTRDRRIHGIVLGTAAAAPHFITGSLRAFAHYSARHKPLSVNQVIDTYPAGNRETFIGRNIKIGVGRNFDILVSPVKFNKALWLSPCCSIASE